jgi:NAD dependent epimerase/dehydratase family enzyme
MNAKTIVIPGGNGFLGRSVSRFFADRGWKVIVLSRNAAAKVSGASVIQWDGKTLGQWTEAVNGAEVVLNLAGRSVNCRYNAKNRAEIETSRIDSTRAIGEAIASAANKPRVWLNSATATIYRHAEDRAQDEFTGEIGNGFSVNVATAWEKAFFDVPAPGVRKIALRSAMVMGVGRSRCFIDWFVSGSAGAWRADGRG